MRRLTFPIAAFAALLVVSGCARTGGPAAAAPFDQQFIDMMVPHHEGAVEMARIAEARGKRPEIKTMAADIIRTQADEIERMKAWRKTWYGSDQTPPMSRMPMVDGVAMATPSSGGHGGGHGGMASKDPGKPAGGATMDMAAEVEQLRTAAEPFDRAFIDAMIPHHESAIAAARAAASRAEHAEIKELARAVVADQEREIAQMRQWRQVWFPG